MNIFRKPLVFLLLICLLLGGCAASPAASDPSGEPSSQPASQPATEGTLEVLDHAAAVSLDLSSDTAKTEATVRSFIDGDTVHFHVPEEVIPGGILKARFLAINTPESTGKIEEYGKTAARFTMETLSRATSIILESETAQWNVDSTGDRYLTWVWYRTEETGPYRNLNIEILQNGLALPNSAAQNRYGETCMAAIAQSKQLRLHLYSGQKDPNFYYGEAVELTLKELRANIESYNGMKVAFSGVITMNSGTQGVYIEDYDPETDACYGMYIYYGHNLNGAGLDVLSVGNEARIVGTVQYYEAGGTWQVSGLNYRMMQPDDPGNIQKLSEGNAPAWVLTDTDTFVNGTITILGEEEEKTFPWAQMALGTSIEMLDLFVAEAYTSDDGAITLTCVDEDKTITIRTIPMRDESGALIPQEYYLGRTISVRGIVDYYNGACQIKVFTPNHITIVE